MPFNDNDVYEPSEQLEMALKKWISKYLYSRTHGCTEKEYEEIFDLLCNMEEKFYKQYDVSNADSNLTFETKQDMKQFALSKISKKLYQLEERRNKSTSNEEEEGWTKCETNVKEIVTKIWKIWCDEREHHPRAGIIPIYYGPSGSIEILLAIYYKNNSIQCGFAKGKFEFGDDAWDCAPREGAQELGLDASYIYKLIQNLSPIKKNVFYADLNTSIEHFYFVIPVRTKEIPLQLNRQEIHDAEWHNIFTLPCCIYCQIKGLMQSVDSSKESNYFMVTCADRYKHNPLVIDILMHMDEINGSKTAEQYKTIHRLCRRK